MQVMHDVRDEMRASNPRKDIKKPGVASGANDVRG